MSILADAHADAPILVEAEEHVAEPTRHHVHQRGGVPFQRHRADGLSDLRVHHYDLPRVDDEEVMLVCEGEGDLAAVYLWNALLASARGAGEGGTTRR